VAVGAVAPFAALGAVLYAVWRWLVRPRLPRRPAGPTTPPATLPTAPPVTED
jgi:hypothetical protein